MTEPDLHDQDEWEHWHDHTLWYVKTEPDCHECNDAGGPCCDPR